jgi:hypothetical protein
MTEARTVFISGNERDTHMYEISEIEIAKVSGGELSCDVGIPSGVKCTGTLSEWGAALSAGYDWLVGKAADGMCAATGNC